MKSVEITILLTIFILAAFLSYACFKRKLQISVLPVVILNSIVIVAWGFLLGVTHDESVHVHLMWLVSQGMVPYRDFWQHTSPFLWVLLAPALEVIKPSLAIFDIARIFAGVVCAVNIFLGWQIARKVWGDRASFPVYCLILSSVALSAQFLLLRPDIFMCFFLLAVVSFSLDIPGKRPWLSFLAGICIALAASFITKQYLLFLLPIVAILIGEKRSWIQKFFLYLTGLMAGFVPLFSYLQGQGIVQDYMNWVFRFNSKIIVFLVSFPLGVLVMAIGGGIILLQWRYAVDKNKAFILLTAFCLSTLSSLTTTSNVAGGYYLFFWFFLCAILASGVNIHQVLDRIPSLILRSVAVGLAAAIFMASGIAHLLQYKNAAYSTDKKVVSQLLDHCASDTCLAIAPSHPVLAQDATMLYSFWQYSFADIFSIVRQDVQRKPVATNILALRPALVLCQYQKKDFILELFQKDLVSASDYKKLVIFFKENYKQKRIGKEVYYVRNDKL